MISSKNINNKMLSIKKITSGDDILLLKKCLKDSPEGTKTFRYFKTRDFTTLKNHKVTFLYFAHETVLLNYKLHLVVPFLRH